MNNYASSKPSHTRQKNEADPLKSEENGSFDGIPSSCCYFLGKGKNGMGTGNRHACIVIVINEGSYTASVWTVKVHERYLIDKRKSTCAACHNLLM